MNINVVGACKNCGAMSHKTIECVERPRSRGAWKTNKDIQADEVFVDVRSQEYGKLTFDAKRDQWLGYDPKEHEATVDRYDKIDQERRKKKMEEMAEEDQLKRSKQERKKKLGKDRLMDDQEKEDSDSDSDSDVEGSSDEEDFRDKEGGRVISERVARQGGVGGAELKTTVRNLRIREDTAKYLRNLNPNSAFYDPKSRSMRDNPTPDIAPENLTFVGDNFIRQSGDAQKLMALQSFAWDAHEKGTRDIHPLANPSQTEFMRVEFEAKKKKLEALKKQRIVDKYGSDSTTSSSKTMPKEMLYAQNETYVEYARDGRVLKGGEVRTQQSKYVEDVLEQNHTCIWGSWYDTQEHQWGYACCHSKIRKSYCTGEAGKQAKEAALTDMTERAMLAPPSASGISSSDGHHPLAKKSELYGEQLAPVLDETKLRQAIEKSKTKREEKHDEADDRKRKYNSASRAQDVSVEDMEAYRLQKSRHEDPMAQFLNTPKE